MNAAALIMASMFAIGGVFSLIAAVAGWDWFFRSPNVKALTMGVGKRWQRVIYGIAGLLMIAASTRIILDIMER